MLAGTWRYDSAAKQIVADLASVGADDVYRVSLDIGIVGEGTTPMRVERIALTERRQTFTIAADSAPTSVRLDPNTYGT
ncbi:hypothetical protein BH09GEM1_BH09GEM1_27170 [soil metagenome]